LTPRHAASFRACWLMLTICGEGWTALGRFWAFAGRLVQTKRSL
jgi:hypothetical protein